MAKFCLSDSDSVIASVKDPVALDCISKLTQNATDNTAIITSQSLISQQDLAVSPVTQEPTLPPPMKVDSSPRSTVQDLSPIPPLTPVTAVNPSNSDVRVISHHIGTVGRQTTVASEMPSLYFAASGDLLPLPVITLPLVACSITGDNIPAVNTDKSFVTVAAVTDLSSLSENVIIKPAYSPL